MEGGAYDIFLANGDYVVGELGENVDIVADRLNDGGAYEDGVERLLNPFDINISLEGLTLPAECVALHLNVKNTERLDAFVSRVAEDYETRTRGKRRLSCLDVFFQFFVDSLTVEEARYRGAFAPRYRDDIAVGHDARTAHGDRLDFVSELFSGAFEGDTVLRDVPLYTDHTSEQ